MRHLVLLLVITMLSAGCISLPKPTDNKIAVPTPTSEAAWIRNGEPIQFEGDDWYPTDEVENILDNEIYQVGVYRDVIFFLEKTDVRPFERVYTRFAKNRYRAFERRE